jgi:hypothetical protein
MVPPSPSSEQGRTTGPATTLSANLHQVGEHFIEAISEVESGSLVEGVVPDRTEDPNQLIQNIRFKATIRGWSHQAHQHRVTALLSLQNEPLVRRMRENQDLILLPANWWQLAMDTLEPNDPISSTWVTGRLGGLDGPLHAKKSRPTTRPPSPRPDYLQKLHGHIFQ